MASKTQKDAAHAIPGTIHTPFKRPMSEVRDIDPKGDWRTRQWSPSQTQKAKQDYVFDKSLVARRLSLSQGKEEEKTDHDAASDKLGPVIVWHYCRPGPVFAIGIGSCASEEAIMRVLENRNPGRRFRVLEPLKVQKSAGGSSPRLHKGPHVAVCRSHARPRVQGCGNH